MYWSWVRVADDNWGEVMAEENQVDTLRRECEVIIANSGWRQWRVVDLAHTVLTHLDRRDSEVAALKAQLAAKDEGIDQILAALNALYSALRVRHHGRMPDDVQAAYDNAGSTLAEWLAQRHQGQPK